CAIVHRMMSDVVPLEFYRASVRLDDTDYHVERGCLPCTIGSEQTDDFAGIHCDGDAVYHSALLVLFDELLGPQKMVIHRGSHRSTGRRGLSLRLVLGLTH